jgi:16S rRNA processing protein RimM
MYKIASITKAHGTRGEVVVIPDFDFEIDENQLYFLKNNRGDFYPVRFEQFRTISKGGKTSFFVLLTGINDRNSAEELRGCSLYSETDPQEHSEMRDPTVFDSIGFEIIDRNERIGVVTEVLDNPAHPILVISHEPDNHQFMVPFVSVYIDDIDFKNRLVYVSDIQELITL